MYFIDSNIFLRFLTKDSKSIEECSVLLKLIKENKLKAVTSSIVLAEIVWTLSSYYKYSKEEITPAINAIIHLQGLRIIDGYDPAIAIESFVKHKVKFIDSLIASIPEIQKKEWIVISYDRDFDKLGVLRKEPGEMSS